MLRSFAPLFVLCASLVSGCGESDREAVPEIVPEAPPSPVAHRPVEVEALRAPEEVSGILLPWTGDLGDMAERKLVRVAIGRGGFFYYIRDGRQYGLTSETVRAFEEFLNKRFATRGTDRIHVVTVPMTPDRVIPAVVGGLVDIAAGGLTATEERQALVDFAEPWLTEVKEVIVTGPVARGVETLEDLSGREVVVRVSSSYYESLVALNESFEAQGIAPIEVIPAHEIFADEDLLEMVSVGMIGLTVTDDYFADFWAQVFTDLEVRGDLAVREGGRLAWAIRKDSPELQTAIGEFVKANRPGTLMGNIMRQRYLDDPRKVVNALSGDSLRELSAEEPFFRRYGGEYGFDWLQLAAQGFQESRLDNNKQSPAGAVGIMQVMPDTARLMRVKDFTTMDGNIRAGASYMRYLVEEYFSDETIEPMDRWLLALAGYNAGGARISRLRAKAAEQGLDPDRWFGNVEQIVAGRVGPETVNYVRNVMKYYLAYRLTFEREQLRQEVLTRLARAQ